MKNIVKTVVFIMIILMIITINSTTYGFSVSDLQGTKFDNANAKSLVNVLITAFSVIGSVISVVVLVVLGIKYMLGSTEEKAQYKQSLLPYVIGCILVFAASPIAGIVYSIIPK